MEHIHHLIDEKKWTLVLREVDLWISSVSNLREREQIILIFESIDKSFKEQNAKAYYLEMWKIAFDVGKIKLAKFYAEQAIAHLVELKRIPRLKNLFHELHERKILKSHPMKLYSDFLEGKGGDVLAFSNIDSGNLELHPELWKNTQKILKEFLIFEDEWRIDHWKLAYEFILKFYFDNEIFQILTAKAIEMKNQKHEKEFLEFLEKKNIKFQLSTNEKREVQENQFKTDSLHLDYDQIAMDIMSGGGEPSITEQRKILFSLEALSPDELVTKGRDMVVAFGLLGMDKVVVRLCEKIIPTLSDVQERASLQFMMAQSLFNNGNFYKAIDTVNDVVSQEPLLQEELVAFEYLKAECFIKLKKYNNAKEIFLQIKKYNSHYRLVNERLRQIEAVK